MTKWICEDSHVTEARDVQPLNCTHTRRGYTMRAPDALVVPPACDKPLRILKCDAGRHRISIMSALCLDCGATTEDIEKEPRSFLKPWKDPECCQLGDSCCIDPAELVDL